ncbi:hypothetical protein RND81_04G013600 [Saponaria officinalis]|uniref:rRNA N-glycosylase n=1 Tax=Saponaria officinalis TaxID=3572 RepID=A0AAW1LGN6_SAPOF
MKSVIVLVITWAILQSSIWATDFTLNLKSGTPAEYSAFLAGIRNNVKDATLVYGGTDIPVIGKNAGTYLRVDLIASVGTISIGVRRSDLYVVAYLATNEKKKFVAHFFKGLIDTSQQGRLIASSPGAENRGHKSRGPKLSRKPLHLIIYSCLTQ